MSGEPQLTAVRSAHRFDEAALVDYLHGVLPEVGDALEVLQFEGGQSNPTYRIETRSARYVMRKKPPGELLRSAHQVDREYRVMAALRDTGVPVPEMVHYCEDPSIVGTAFFLMEYVEGRVMTDSTLPGFAPDERRALYDHFAEVLATLHGIDPDAVGLSDFGRPGNYYERQISRWSKQYRASRTSEIAEMEALMEWLPSNVPESDESGIVHGDYRIGNCLLHPTEPRITAVVDWELSTLGHPLADLAYACQGYRGEDTPGQSLVGIDHAAMGIPTEDEFVARYCTIAGRKPIENWTFYMVFVMFRSASIVQGVYKRGLDGNASSERAGEFGEMVKSRARDAWSLVQRGGDA